MLIAEYTKYSRFLGIYTLAIRIRQHSWWIQELLKSINSNIKKLKESVNKIDIKKKETFFSKDLIEVRNTSKLLASELSTWMHHLKLIYFHDSAILHLQLKLLLNIYKKINERKKEKIDLKKHTKEKQQIRLLKNKLKESQKEIKYISKADEAIIHSLMGFKKGFNKALRKGFSPKTFTFLKEQRISQKIKIKAKLVKDAELKRRSLMTNLDISNGKQIKKIADLLEKEIKAVEKDVLYDRQLIKKLKNKKRHIEKIINHLGKKMFRMKFGREVINRTLLYLKKPFKDLETSIHSSLEKMFRNALRQLNMARRKSKEIAA